MKKNRDLVTTRKKETDRWERKTTTFSAIFQQQHKSKDLHVLIHRNNILPVFTILTQHNIIPSDFRRRVPFLFPSSPASACFFSVKSPRSFYQISQREHTVQDNSSTSSACGTFNERKIPSSDTVAGWYAFIL